MEIRRFNFITPFTKWAIEELHKDGVIDLSEELDEKFIYTEDGLGHLFTIKNEEPLSQEKYAGKIVGDVKSSKWEKPENIKENQENIIARTSTDFIFPASYKDGVWYKINEKKEEKVYKNSKNIIGWMKI